MGPSFNMIFSYVWLYSPRKTQVFHSNDFMKLLDYPLPYSTWIIEDSVYIISVMTEHFPFKHMLTFHLNNLYLYDDLKLLKTYFISCFFYSVLSLLRNQDWLRLFTKKIKNISFQYNNYFPLRYIFFLIFYLWMR